MSKAKAKKPIIKTDVEQAIEDAIEETNAQPAKARHAKQPKHAAPRTGIARFFQR